ncbi:uncharacterized protein LOC106070740 isoform X3 [Biomphalaria glabrata]|uniref:Uncharacterized protein LOC106070740 isoform X3 n=1 Tax=Biomphalaria glabrata TaxID=6526 RepID=A0A9W3ASL6_BIOGL|nr:uncharacterized protein LOC106070740 isoform X3 [Biomphalaria glabrata]
MSSVTAHSGYIKTWLAQDCTISPQTLLKECYQGIVNLHTAFIHLDRAGNHLVECLALGLQNTPYKSVGSLLTERLSSVFSLAVSSNNVSILKEMEAMLVDIQNSDQQLFQSPSYGQILCHISLLLMKLKKQYFALCNTKIIEVIHSLLSLNGEDEVTKLVFKLGLADGQDPQKKSNASLPSSPWGSPKMRKDRNTVKNPTGAGFRILSFFEKKTSHGRKGESEDMKSQLKEQVPSVPSVTSSHDNQTFLTSSQVVVSPDSLTESQFNNDDTCHMLLSRDSEHFQSSGMKPELATEEELESVINLLSGMGCVSVSSMQALPEIVPPQGPMQLTVPQIYCRPSPSSDTQVDDLKTQKSQIHRRSEGCLDLSSVSRNFWPHQQHHHHRASLPSVQIFSATGQKSGFDTPSPAPSYVCDLPSPQSAKDQPSPEYLRVDPPSPFRSHYANTLGVGLVVGPNMLSPLQWVTGSTGGEVSQSRPWSTCDGVSPLSTGSGVQDCSDLSDDSSIEEQFFAVGKDLSDVIYSKDGSSDEDHPGPIKVFCPADTSALVTWSAPCQHILAVDLLVFYPEV